MKLFLAFSLLLLSQLAFAATPDLIKKYGYDQPLLVNLDAFRSIARKELSARFGTIADDGEIIHKDMLGENGGTFYDFNRLYYVTKVAIDPRLINGEDLYATYMLATQGYSAIGYAKVTNDGRRNISFLFAGYGVGYNDILTGKVDEEGDPIHDKAAEKTILDAAVAQYAAQFPGLDFTPFSFINSFFIEPKDMENPQPAELEALGKFLEATRTDAHVKYIELQPEYAVFVHADHVTSFGEGQGQSIDLNALRSITLEYLKAGSTPVNGLVPYLPQPFGDGIKKTVED